MNDRATILVVEDNDIEREALSRLLRSEGFRVSAAAAAEDALQQLGTRIDLVVSDLKVERMDGLELLERWKRASPPTPFVMCTGYGSISSAVEALQKGAEDYLVKPFEPARLIEIVRQLLQESPPNGTQAPAATRDRFHRIISRSPAMRRVVEMGRRAAAVDNPVLISGEPGTGKELIAESIHRLSGRWKGPFTAIHMESMDHDDLDRELFGRVDAQAGGQSEPARGGTVFINDISALSLSAQVQLLRLLDSRPNPSEGKGLETQGTVRVIAGTSQSLETRVAHHGFLDDLFYRLSVIHLQVPPLRQRTEDVIPLTRHFLEEFAGAMGRAAPGLQDRLARHLEQYSWPGNVRQLRHVVESMCAICPNDTLTLDDFPEHLRAAAAVKRDGVEIPDGLKLEDLERAAIQQTLERCRGNRTHAAQKLGISVRTLQRKIKAWGLDE